MFRRIIEQPENLEDINYNFRVLFDLLGGRIDGPHISEKAISQVHLADDLLIPGHNVYIDRDTEFEPGYDPSEPPSTLDPELEVRLTAEMATHYAIETNGVEATAGTEFTEILYTFSELDHKTTCIVNFTANLAISDPADVTARVYVNDTEHQYQPSTWLSEGSHTYLMNFRVPFEDVVEGNKRFSVELKISTGTITIAPQEAWLVVEAKGITVPTESLDNDVAFIEIVPESYPDDPVVSTSIKDGGKHSVAVQEESVPELWPVDLDVTLTTIEPVKEEVPAQTETVPQLYPDDPSTTQSTKDGGKHSVAAQSETVPESVPDDQLSYTVYENQPS